MKKVLIIEDDQLVANIYRNKLAVEGFRVEVAHTGEAALTALPQFQPDALLLDLVLPQLSGLDVMKNVRATPAFEKLPIIVFSNTYLSTMVQEAWKAGATKCLSKANCTPKQVIEAVRSVLGLTVETSKPAVIEPRAKLTAPVPAPAPIPSPAAKSASSASADVRTTFAQSFPETLTILRQTITALAKATTDAERLNFTQDIYSRVHGLTGQAHLAGRPEFAQLTEALEAMIMEMHQKPNTITASTLRTLAAAVDFLPALLERPSQSSSKPVANSNILVVDDEPISRRAVTHALERAKLRAVGVDDPNVALKLLTESSYDLVFLDVDMPGMNGHELCTRLRALPRHQKTPVVFVTSLNDFQNRANSTMSGGNDFIAKPFPFLELAVKSLVYVLRNKYATPKRP